MAGHRSVETRHLKNIIDDRGHEGFTQLEQPQLDVVLIVWSFLCGCQPPLACSISSILYESRWLIELGFVFSTRG